MIKPHPSQLYECMSPSTLVLLLSREDEGLKKILSNKTCSPSKFLSEYFFFCVSLDLILNGKSSDRFSCIQCQAESENDVTSELTPNQKVLSKTGPHHTEREIAGMGNSAIENHILLKYLQ